ncbi:cell wall-binding protein [Clostridium sp. BJN0001]|uniref:cell wall-binding protein n=1 Tax=Clostridium sp. BJN0001 TaxID=2930219 RepID=UPI001FD29C27|nr:cell wall-binding protein [Clostridium sp. BJN0001]
MGYDIYIANKDKSKVLQLPVIPAELPTITKSITNEEFKSYNAGTYNFIKEKGLDTFSIDTWIPCDEHDYYFTKSDLKAKEFINFLNAAIDNKEFIQIVIIKSDGTTFVNDKYSIESFTHGVKKNGDYSYSLGVKQYREISKNAYALGWNRNGTGWWYCYDYDNYKWYASCWQFIEGEWYYFDENGYALCSQWFLWKNEWYYLDENCKAVHSAWKQINGKWYYFYDSSCKMAHDCYTPDGYWVDSNGAWRQ